ncbi:MAG: hypothetical protein JXB88_04225 [Spirochaetales bacterium]|nr:hypothetical protein [Spirochaetales bacterium]
MRFMNFFLSGYDDELMLIRKKAKATLIAIISLEITCFLYIVSELFFSGKIDIIIIYSTALLVILISLFFLKKHKYEIASNFVIFPAMAVFILHAFINPAASTSSINLYVNVLSTLLVLIMACLIGIKKYQINVNFIISLVFHTLFIILRLFPSGRETFNEKITNIVSNYFLFILSYFLLVIINNILNETIQHLTTSVMDNKKNAEESEKSNIVLTRILNKSKDIITNLKSTSKTIDEAAQEQAAGANEYSSSITEVNSTLHELTITAKQITKNIGELVLSSEEMVKLLQEKEKQLLQIVSKLEDAGEFSNKNTVEIKELGKRSVLINTMVELIKEIANKTNILSINASIEAARSKAAGSGFSVIAAEIRELSKETIDSAKKVEKAGKEIQDSLNSIIMSSKKESEKVMESGEMVKSISGNVKDLVARINNTYGFTQKIDTSIKQQENGSVQVANTMRQMSEIARQSAETAGQIFQVAKNIVDLGNELEQTVEYIE